MCPAAYELVLWHRGELSDAAALRVKRHVYDCKRCQTVLAHESDLWGQFDERPVPEAITHHFAAGTSEVLAPSAIEPGQLWMTRDVPGIVIITQIGEQPDMYRAHPISFATTFLSDRDLWLDAADSCLGSSAMVETWLEVPIDSMGLSCFLGTISTDLVDAVRTVANGRELTRHSERLGPALQGRRDVRYDHQLRELELWRPASERVNRQMTALDKDEEAISDDTVHVTLEGGGFVLGVVAIDQSEQGQMIPLRLPDSLTADDLFRVRISVPDGAWRWAKRSDEIPITSDLHTVIESGVEVSYAQHEPVHLVQPA